MKFRQNLVKFQRNLRRKLSKFDVLFFFSFFLPLKNAKNSKICDEILLKFSGRSGAKECKSCRAQKMLQNAPFLAIVAVDTDENEPPKVRQLDN